MFDAKQIENWFPDIKQEFEGKKKQEERKVNKKKTITCFTWGKKKEKNIMYNEM